MVQKEAVSSMADAAGVRSVEIGMTILKAIAKSSRSMTLSEIARATELQRPTVYRYLASLMRVGMIKRLGEQGLYDLGSDAVSVGFAALARMETRAIALEKLTALNGEIDKCVALFTWVDGGPTIIGWRESREPITFSVHLGVQMSPIQSVGGRLFLANLPSEETDSILADAFKDTPTQRWGEENVDLDEYRRRLDVIKQRGLACGRSELIPGIDAIGAPAFDHERRVAYALVAIGATAGLDTSWTGPVAKALADAAKDLSDQLGYHALELTEPKPKSRKPRKSTSVSTAKA